MSWIGRKCPICSGNCGEALPKVGDQREISCTVCGRYRITETAESRLAGDPPPARAAVLRRAVALATTSSEMPLISLNLLEN